MSENLRKHFPKLEVISQVKSLKSRKKIIQDFSNDPTFCDAVREIVRNTFNKNIKVTDADRKKLLKYRGMLMSLNRRQKCRKRVKKLIQQTGTGIFLPIVIPLVSTLLAELFRK